VKTTKKLKNVRNICIIHLFLVPLHPILKESRLRAKKEDGFDCLQPREKMLKLVPQDQTVACGFIFAKYQNGTW